MTQITAYICVSPRGLLIRQTIRCYPDESWQVLLASSVSEPNTLVARGWTVEKLSCELVDMGAAEVIRQLRAVPLVWPKDADELLRAERDPEP